MLAFYDSHISSRLSTALTRDGSKESRRLGALAFGFRRDLDLDIRWWHRLAKVALVLLLLTGGTLSFLVVLHSFWPSPTTQNTTVITLRD